MQDEFVVDYKKCLSLETCDSEIKVQTPPENAPPTPMRFTRSMTSLSSATSADFEENFKRSLNDNISKVLKCLRMFDYNRDCRIQKPELKKALDSAVLKLSDQQFERLWNKYEINQNGSMTTNYHDFLRRMGINNSQLQTVQSGSKSGTYYYNSFFLSTNGYGFVKYKFITDRFRPPLQGDMLY